MGKTYEFASPLYPQLAIAPAGEGQPGGQFEGGVLATDDADLAARVRNTAKHDPSLGITGDGIKAEAEEDEAPAAPEGPEGMSYNELKAMASGMGLDTTGKRPALLKRVLEAQAAADAEAAAAGGNGDSDEDVDDDEKDES